MSKNNLDKLGLVDCRTYTQDQLREQFNKMKTSNQTEEYNNIKVIYIEDNIEKTTIINIADNLNISKPPADTETKLSAASDLQQSVKD
jgi:hypothetical protein